MYSFIFYTLFYILNTQFIQKQLPIADFAIVAEDGLSWLSIVTSPQLICDVPWMCVTGIVTSYSSFVLARANWRKGDLHQWLTTVNIDYSTPGIHGLAYKKLLHTPSATYKRQWTGQSLVRVMVCRLLGAKPLPEPMLAYYQLDPLEHTSMKFESKYKSFHSWKCIWMRRLPNGGHIVREGYGSDAQLLIHALPYND